MDQTRTASNAWHRAPVVMSLFALALVVATAAGATGSYPAHDEGWQAHVFQLLMVLQLPIIFQNVLAGRRRLLLVGAETALWVVALSSVALVG